NCGGEAKEPFQFSGKGSVFSYTVIHNPPTGFEGTAPYTVAIVQLDEGPMVTAQLTDLGEQEAEIGMPVEMVTRLLRQDDDERSTLIYGYKFRPILAGAR
ncbi:MAG: Zn-ribbon domain-containing OB-fold protein, partial [Bacillota bacterium]